MTTSDKITLVVDCWVKGAAFKKGTNGPYLDIQVQRDGRQYPEAFKSWNPDELKYLVKEPNTRHKLILQRGRVKNDKTDDGQFGSYWWDAIGEAESTPEVPQHPQPPDSGTVATTARPEPIPAASRPTQIDPRQQSIERRVAFKAVIDLMIADKLDPVDMDNLTNTVDYWTNQFLTILAGQFNPNPPPAQTSQTAPTIKGSLVRLNKMRKTLGFTKEALAAKVKEAFDIIDPYELSDKQITELRAWMSETARAKAVTQVVLEDDIPFEVETPILSAMPQSDMELAKLVLEKGYDWQQFEAKVLKMTWSHWVEVGGNVVNAWIRFQKHLEQHPEG